MMFKIKREYIKRKSYRALLEIWYRYQNVKQHSLNKFELI